MRLKDKLLTSLLLVPLASTGAWAKDRVNFDAFLVTHEAKGLAATEEQLHSRGVRVDGQEERLGLPTVLWNDRYMAERNTTLATQKPEQAARTHLQKFADLYRLSSEDVASASLQSVHNTGTGPIIARFGQKVGGVEVFRSNVNVVMDRQNNLVAVTGYLSPHEAVAARLRSVNTDFPLSAADAVARAFKDMTGTAISARSLTASGAQGDYTQFSFETGVSAVMQQSMSAPARAKKVYFTLPSGLQPAYYVELAVGGKSSKDSDYYSFVVSATDGALLFRNNLTADDSYSYRVWADPISYIPYDGPQGNDPSPNPTGTPNGYQAPFLPANLITLQNVTFGRNDPWLAPNATQTSGNNADAYLDLAAPDGYQPETDVRATTTAPGVFDYTYDVTKSPSFSLTQRKAATAHLFYLNNFLHDWYYDSGFDELAGNAQARNLGRGGLENDSIKAEAQDYGGRNNANMSTPADGSRPRMQMFVFDGVPALTVLAPASLAGPKDAGSAAFGAASFTTTGNVLIPNPAGVTEACTALPAGTFAGKVALIDRGTCGFAVKAKVAQDAGAIAVIIANNVAGVAAPGMAGVDATITVPVLSTTKEAGDAMKTEVRTNGSTISVQLTKGADSDRDGTIDNTIVAHEWGHYISNRLIGNSNGLSNNQGRSMGEGWADFHAMLMVVRDEDRSKPGNNTFQGVYALAAYVSSGGANNGYYYGIRRVPYSTDLTKNGLTYRHIANGNPLPTTHPVASGATGLGNAEVHNAGEVWANMLWECYASLLNAHPFQEAQDRMKRYVVAAYKATPNAPTMLEARDALLAVAAATDLADYSRFTIAFAKRGAGFGAKAPDRESADHIGAVESFVNGNNLDVLSVRLDDSETGCDQDGVLDVGETGRFTVKLRNNGFGDLSAFTGTVTASGATAAIAFPNGNTLSFPALARGATATASVNVKLNAVTGTTPRAGLSVAITGDPLPPSAQSITYDERVHYDEASSGSAKDAFDTQVTNWTSGLIGSTAGWAPATEKNADGTTNRYIHVPDLGVVSDVVFTTPWMQVNPTGSTVLSFRERHSLEGTIGSAGFAAPFYDGVVVEISLDDITWYDLFNDLGYNPGYANYIEVGDNPLSDRPAFVGSNTAFPGWNTRSVNFGGFLGDLPVRFRFRIGTDSAVGAYGFDVDDFQVTNTTSLPFANLKAETSDGTVCNRSPVADVGQSPRTVPEYDTSGNHTVVTLNGSASYDPDGQPLTYQWTQIAGDPVTLSNPTSATPSFTVDVPYDSAFVFQLVVNDGVESSEPKSAIIVVPNTNKLPVAQANGPATVPERSTATLTASGSGDEDGEPLTYAWTQVPNGAPAVTLSNPASANPSFATPEVPADTDLVFQLVVNDGYEDSLPATVTVKVLNVDRLPVVDAGLDKPVEGRRTVVLSGSATDEDGEAITYAWTQESGTPVSIEAGTSATASFTSPDVKTQEVLTFKLTATANGASGSDSVSIIVLANRAPNVNAGVDLLVEGRKTVTLFGSASDPENDSISYKWTQDAADASQVNLTGDTTPTATFTSPDAKVDTVLHFTLTVTTANGQRTSDTVTVTVHADRAPVANAGPDQTANGGILVTLAGFASDAEGDALTYAWTQAGSDSTQVTLAGANTANPTFTAPTVAADTVLHFTLTVIANGLTSTDTVDVTVRATVDHAPVANAGPDQSVAVGASVTLSGFGNDQDGDTVSFQWTQVGTPTVTLAGASTATATFTAPNVAADTVLHFTLTVTANGKTATDSVDLTVRANIDHAPTANAGADRTVKARDVVTLQGFGSDVDGDAVSYLWTAPAGVTLTGGTTATPSFTAADVKADTVLHFTLTVTANGKTATDLVDITVQKFNRRPVGHGPAALEEKEATSITLDGSQSTDPDGDTLSYHWVQTGGATVAFTGQDSAQLTFTTPEVREDTTLSFLLVVKDVDGLESEPVSVTVKVLNVNKGPVAQARQLAGGASGEKVVLDSFGSTDADGEALTYKWEQTDGPEVSLSSTTEPSITFDAPDTKTNITLGFKLTVTDSHGVSASKDVTVEIAAAKEEEKKGCSTTGNSSGGAMLLAMLAGVALSRRRGALRS